MKPPRAVCDVTVYVEAALRPDSSSGGLLRRFVEARDFELVVSRAILDEIERALCDPELRNQLTGPWDLRRWSAALGVLTTVVDPQGDVPPVGQEPRDDKYLAAALISGALVVSSDPRLLAVTGLEGLEILTPGGLLEVLEAGRRTKAPKLRPPARRKQKGG